MNVGVMCFWIQPDAEFPLSMEFQRYISEQLSALVDVSPAFAKRFGPDWGVSFILSANGGIAETRLSRTIRLRKYKDVEFTVYLAYDPLSLAADPIPGAVRAFLDAVRTCLRRIALDDTKIAQKTEEIVQQVTSVPEMRRTEDRWWEK